MIDEKKLIERLWGLYGSRYNLSMVFEYEDTMLANRILGEVQQLIEAQPKVGEWIPVSERLPEEEEAYSYTEENDTFEPNEFIVMIEGAELPTVAFFDGEDFTGGYNCEFFNEVIAWMPLPPAYRKDVE
jgi:hypothetical protein